MAVFNAAAFAAGGMHENVYFAEETRIGTWIDGKPLYRRCFVKEFADIFTEDTTLGPGEDGVTYELVNSYGSFNGNQLPYISYGEYNSQIVYFSRARLTVEDNCFMIDARRMSSGSDAFPAKIIAVFEYTKTTGGTAAE